MALISLNDVTMGFGGPPVLDGVGLQIQPGERVCLLGRNGTGKTTLMKIINGDLEPDGGTVARQQEMTTALLTQDVPGSFQGTVFDVVLGGLGKKGELPAQYHRLSHQLAREHDPALLKQLDRVQGALDASQGWDLHRQAETVITRLALPEDDPFDSLSAGLKRRVLMARALVCRPDILLLDEPTNHLDIDSITGLEELLLKYGGTLLFVTHDRMLVKKLSTRIIELDRGRMSSWDCGYEEYLGRKAAVLDAEQAQWREFDKKLAREEEWIRRGIKARRTRNEGRVSALMEMRKQRQARREQMGSAKMQIQGGQRSGKLVVEAQDISFSHGGPGEKEKPVVQHLTTLIMRGDRVGIIGPNGCGKTTLLRLLLGELTPQTGTLRTGTNLEIAYFDQLRNSLEDEKSVRDNVAGGRDQVVVNGNTRHVVGYLRDFLFDPERANSPVKVLSGGERNRLLLAKLFALPSNLLVMDEPTNDLDIETLELLEELLAEYAGTLLLVSHDRTFLNNVVTNTLVFEGESPGQISEYIGGYDDWASMCPGDAAGGGGGGEKPKTDRRTAEKTSRPRKLTNKEKQELEALPQRIEQQEKEQEELHRQLADPAIYRDPDGGERVAAAKKRLETLETELEGSYHRWEELERLLDQYKDARG